MNRIGLSGRLQGLRHGRRWWAAEIVLRLLGVGLLAASWRLSRLARALEVAAPPHGASALELAVCAVVVVLLCSGLTLAAVGPGLFGQVPLPPHFTVYPDKKP